MKIILTTPLYPPEIGGPATYIKELSERLRDDHEITVVAFASTAEPIPGIKLITVSKKRALPLRLIKFAWVLYRAAKGADVIYAQNAVAAGFPSMIVGKILSIPVVIKFVGDEAWERASQQKLTKKQLEEFLADPDPVPWYIAGIRMIEGWTLRGSTRVSTPSAYLCNAIVAAYHIPKERALVNYNATEKSEVLPFNDPVNKHQVVVTARLVEWKGVRGVIRAIGLLVPRYPDVKLLVAGDGPLEDELHSLVRDLKIEKNVEFLGRISRAETWHIRKTSRVYVLNSTYEGLPHTVLTSFSAGIPTVATNVPGTNEAVYHEKTGLLVEPGDDRALADAIARLFEDDKLCDMLVANATKIIDEKFSWDAHLKNLIDLFTEIKTT